MSMLTQHTLKKQLPKEIYATFSELQIFHFLRRANISKKKGIATSVLFAFVFGLSSSVKIFFTP